MENQPGQPEQEQLAQVHYIDEKRGVSAWRSQIDAMEPEQLELYEAQLNQRIDESVKDVLDLKWKRALVMARILGIDQQDGEPVS